MSKVIPQCAGEYEFGDLTCNGDSSSCDELDKAPCAWRDRCVAFQAFLEDRGKTIDDYLDSSGRPKKSANHFRKMCAAQVTRYGVVNGLVTIKQTKPKRKPSKKAMVRSAKALSRLVKQRQSKLHDMFQHFKAHLIENLDGIKFAPPKSAVVPGMLYTVDRAKKSNYIAIYYKKMGKIGIPLAQLNLKALTVTFDIELPVSHVSFEGIGQSVMKKIHPEPISNGRFKSVCKGMDTEGTALVAQTIARLIKNETIKLP